MDKLHLNLVEEIISRVPPESIIQAKLVCKTWLNILSNKKFGILFSFSAEYPPCEESSVKLYYGDIDDIINHNDNRPLCSRPMVKIDHPPIEKQRIRNTNTIIGSCNGLVCFAIQHQDIVDPVHICNPFTGEYFDLPRLYQIKRYSFVAGGLGYLQSTNEYKVLRVYYPRPTIESRERFVQVCTLGYGCGWRNIKGTINYEVKESGGTFGPNGMIYFTTTDYNIVGFDLREEKFRVLPSPSCFRNLDYDEKFDLLVLGGDLCFVHLRYPMLTKRGTLDRKKPRFVDIWSFKEKNGRWNWSKVLRMGCPKDEWRLYDPLFITKKHELVLWDLETGICIYDPKTKTIKRLTEQDNRLNHFEAILHMNTNISLRYMGVRSKKRRREEEKKKLHAMLSVLDNPNLRRDLLIY